MKNIPMTDPTVQSGQTAPLRSRLLIVDDDTLLTWSLANALTRVGYEVTVARSGEKALLLLGEERFDIVVTDFDLPGAGGKEIAAFVRGLGREIPIVLMSASEQDEMLGVSADVFVEKPFDLNEMVKTIDTLASLPSGRAKAQNS